MSEWAACLSFLLQHLATHFGNTTVVANRYSVLHRTIARRRSTALSHGGNSTRQLFLKFRYEIGKSEIEVLQNRSQLDDVESPITALNLADEGLCLSQQFCEINLRNP